MQHKNKGQLARPDLHRHQCELTVPLKFPANEVKELHKQLLQVQAELKAVGVEHEGKTAEEAYAERLAQIHLDDGVILEGDKVVSTLLARCLLWVEVVEEKYALVARLLTTCD